MHVDHEADKGALHAGAHASEHVEARAGDFDAAVEVDHAGGGAQVPVRLGLKVELARGSPATDLGVIRVILAVRHALVRDVGDAGDQVEEGVLDLAATAVELGDAILVSRHLRLGGLGLVLLALAHELPDLLGDGVALGLELLDLGDDGAALLVELKEPLAVPMGVLAGLARLVNEVGVLADELDVEHAGSLLLSLAGAGSCARPSKYILVRVKRRVIGRLHMQAIADFFTWLFNDRMGVICLILGGIVLCLIISFLMELKTKKRYFNHEKGEGDWDLFGDDES